MNDKKDEIILTQWQTCVEMANSVSQRRDTMNNIFVTVHLALVAAASLTFEMKSIFLLFGGIFLCFLWIYFIRNYKALNTAKFNVIQQLESKLPEAPFKAEWEELRRKNDYIDGTSLEMAFPIVFIVLYIIEFAVIVL